MEETLGEVGFEYKPVQFQMYQAGCFLHVHGEWVHKFGRGPETRARAQDTIDVGLLGVDRGVKAQAVPMASSSGR